MNLKFFYNTYIIIEITVKPDRKCKLCVIAICMVKINYATVMTLLSVSDGALHSDLHFFWFPAGEQLAQGCYAALSQSGFKPTTC